MASSVNLVAALLLLALPAAVLHRPAWFAVRFRDFELLRTVVVAVALVLVPVNLVFAVTGAMGLFNGLVLASSIMALGSQAVWLMHLLRRDGEPAAPRTVASAADDTAFHPPASFDARRR